MHPRTGPPKETRVTIAHVDPVAGVSGQMLLGALIDAGVRTEAVLEALRGLPVAGWELEVGETTRGGLGATLVEINADSAGVVRTWSNVRDLLSQAPLPEPTRARALGAFRRLAEAESRIHRMDLERAHFHDLDVLAAIVAVVGVCTAFHLLDVQRVTCAPVPQGVGMSRTSRGLVPLPAPTVLEVLRGAPTYSVGIAAELCTPTGAALLAEWADGWSELPLMTVRRTGYGAGSASLDRPNVLRLVVGEPVASSEQGAALLLEAVTALPPAQWSSLVDRLRSAGAQHVWTRPVRMDGDEASEVVCLCPVEAGEAVREVLRSDAGASTVVGRTVESWTAAEDPVRSAGGGERSAPRPPSTA
jgi:pyridinium-3,5-bisthiocarboxylic acid mononucleotide nickel chelatase